MKIYFVRHGEAVDDLEDKYGGWYDAELAPNGFESAKITGEKLKSKNIKSVMRKHGFIKLDIPPAFISDKSDIINQAFNYIYIESI